MHQFFTKVVSSGILFDSQTYNRPKFLLTNLHRLVFDLFFDPDVWNSYSLISQLNKVMKRPELFNTQDSVMTIQVLASLKAEAPFLFEQIDQKNLQKFHEHYFDLQKQRFSDNQQMQKKSH